MHLGNLNYLKPIKQEKLKTDLIKAGTALRQL